MKIEDAKKNAKAVGGGLIDHAIALALADGWLPTDEDPHEAGLEILKKGVPLLIADLKKNGIF